MIVTQQVPAIVTRIQNFKAICKLKKNMLKATLIEYDATNL